MINNRLCVLAGQTKNPSLSLDFTTGTVDSRITTTRSGATATAFDKTGTLQTVAANTARVDYGPVPGTTNYTPNNSNAGAIVGTVGSGGAAPTGWSLSTETGLSLAILGTGTINGLPYVDYRVFGTATSSGHLMVNMNTGFTPACVGQTWTPTIWFQLLTDVGTSNVGNLFRVVLTCNGTTSTWINGTNTTCSTLTKLTAPLTITGTTTTSVSASIWSAGPSGVLNGVYDFSIRVAGVMLEFGGVASGQLIATSGTAPVSTAVTNWIRNSVAANSAVNAVTNGTFANAGAGWTTSVSGGTGSVVFSNNSVTVTGDGTHAAQAMQQLTVSAGHSYALTFNVGTNAILVGVGTAQGLSDVASNTYNPSSNNQTLAFTATTSTVWILFAKSAAVPGVVSSVQCYDQAAIPTNWTLGASGNGISYNYLGPSVDANGNAAIDVQVTGTASATVSNATLVSPDASNVIPASYGQSWNTSCNVTLVNGTAVGTTTIDASERNSGGGLLAAHVTALTPTATLTRFNTQASFTNETTAFVAPMLRFNCNSGQVVNFTLRVSQPQLTQTLAVQPTVATSGSAVTTGATARGLLIEEARTNSCRNNTGVGAIASATMTSPSSAPTLGSSVAGALPDTIYYVKTTYVDAVGGETTGSAEASFDVPINNVLTVASPNVNSGATGWNVYVGTTSGAETKQNGSTPIAIGTGWTEPTSGLIVGSAIPGTTTAKNTGTVPTGWVSGQTQVVGTGVETGIAYVDLLYAGNATSTFAIQFDNAIAATTTPGATWTHSVYARIVAGSLTNVSAIQFPARYYQADGTTFISQTLTNVTPSNAPLGMQRFAQTDIAPALTGCVVGGFRFATTGAYNFTIRIGLPQLELGASVTSPIQTSGSAVTRNADVCSISPFSGFSRSGTVEVEGILPTMPSASSQAFVELDDGTSSNRLLLRRDSAGSTINYFDVIGGSTAGSMVGGVLTAQTLSKCAATYTPTALSICTNGGSVGSAVTTGIPPGVNRLLLGKEAGTSYINGYLRKLSYWPRVLSNSELIQVTT